MENLEIKAFYPDLDSARVKAKNLTGEQADLLHQIDTYYHTKRGRLKLREINGIEAQLIPYFKEYQKGETLSLYDVLPSRVPSKTKEILNLILGEEFIIDKKRELYLYKNVRIHLDTVKNLGTFIEFEAVVNSKGEKAESSILLEELNNYFEISGEMMIDASYIDLFMAKQEPADARTQSSLS